VLPCSWSVSRTQLGWITLTKHSSFALKRASPEMVGECEISGQKEHLSFLIEVEPRPRPHCLGQGVFLGPTWAVERARHPDVCFATVAPKINRQQVRIWVKSASSGFLWFLIEVEPRPRPCCQAQQVFLGRQ
jgi:hypothetical protein